MSKGYNVEVAVVAGVEKRGVQADEKIVSEIKSISKMSEASSIISLYEEIKSWVSIPVNCEPCPGNSKEISLAMNYSSN